MDTVKVDPKHYPSATTKIQYLKNILLTTNITHKKKVDNGDTTRPIEKAIDIENFIILQSLL